MALDWWVFFEIIVGALLLYLGAEGLVQGGVVIARRAGLSPLVIGLTVVALGTSLPEALGSFVAQVVHHSGAMAVGNVVGSNIANLGLVLGLVCLVRPQRPPPSFVWRDLPIMVLVLLILIGSIGMGTLSRWMGVVYWLLLLVYLALQIRWGRVLPGFFEEVADLGWRVKSLGGGIVGLVLGSLALGLGAFWLLEGAVLFASTMGISHRAIGLTLVAVGTSLPEIATSLVAVWHKRSDMALGNLIGSNIFNVLFVLGGVAIMAPIQLNQGVEPLGVQGELLEASEQAMLNQIDGGSFLSFDLPVMIGFALLLWGLLWYRRYLSRWEGGLFLLLYVGYVIGLFFL